MADSIRPWISEYLIGNGETFGGDLTAIPEFTKSKKVQLIEFLTYGLTEQDDCIWGRVSDKICKIPARFSKDALSEYNKISSKRLTEHKTVIISIKNFRPFFARIPLGGHTKGMTESPCLALNIESFTIMGGVGEGQWGSPQEVETNADIRLWSEGLRQHGGGGNVLMDRKKEREKAAGPTISTVKSPRRRETIPQRPFKRPWQVALKRPVSWDKTRIPAVSEKPHHGFKTESVDLLKEYERSWRPIYGNPWKYALKPNSTEEVLDPQIQDVARIPPQSASTPPLASSSAPCLLPSQKRKHIRHLGRHVLDLGSSPPAEAARTPECSPLRETSPVERQTTPAPEEWPPSVRGSQADYESVHALSDEEDSSADNGGKVPVTLVAEGKGELESRPETDQAFSNTVSSHSTSPISAKRSEPSLPPPSLPSAPSPDPFSSIEVEGLPSPPSSPLRPEVARKVPYPAQPLPPTGSPTGPARILVPNSDTSAIASQSQSQRLSQSQQPPKSMPPVQQSILPQTQQDAGDSGIAISDGHNHPSQKLGLSQPESYDGDRSSPVRSVVDEIKKGLRKRSPRQVSCDGIHEVSTDSKPQSSSQNPAASALHNRDWQGDRNETQVKDLPQDGMQSQTEEFPLLPTQSEDHQLDDDDAQIDQELFGRPHSGDEKSSKTESDPGLRSTPKKSSIRQVLTTGEEPRTSSPLQPARPSHTLTLLPPNNSLSVQSRPPSRIEPGRADVAPPAASSAKAMTRRTSAQAWVNVAEHDAEAWKKPTFMTKKTSKDNGKEKATSASAVSHDNDSANEKRAIVSNSSTAAQKLKASNRELPQAGKNTISMQLSHSRRSFPHFPGHPLVVRIPTESVASTSTGGQNEKFKLVPIFASSARGSTAKGSRKNVADISQAPAKRTRDRISEGSSDNKGEAVEGSRKKRKVADSNSDSRTSSSTKPLDRKEGGEGKRLGRKDSDVVQERVGSRSQAIHPKSESEGGTLPPAPPSKLGGFTVNFDHIRCDEKGGPPWMSWNNLADILLRTGRDKAKQMKQIKPGGRGPG